MRDFQVSVQNEESATNLTVLRISAAAKNSITQIFSERPQISMPQLESLQKKIMQKLRLNRISDVQTSIVLHFENDRVITFDGFAALSNYDLNVKSLTESISFKWSFVYDPSDSGEEHLHSVFVRISELPVPGMLIQRMLSTRTDDLERHDHDYLAAVACKLDFADSRFSAELLAVVTEWVDAQPKAVSTFGFANFAIRHGEKFSRFVSNTFPVLAVLAYVGAWIGLIPDNLSHSIKFASAWILSGGALFLAARYIAELFNNVFERAIRRIVFVPVFQLTDGDKNRMTRYLAKSHRSAITLALAGVLYGFCKAIGLYLASLLLRSPLLP